jgi:hypothetical protein
MDDQTNERTPVDFSSLGPAVPAARFDALVTAVSRHGETELRRRRGAGAVARVVVAWRRPLLTLSALAAAAAVALFVRATPVQTTGTAAAGTIAEALGVPAAYAESVEGHTVGAVSGGSEKQ